MRTRQSGTGIFNVISYISGNRVLWENGKSPNMNGNSAHEFDAFAVSLRSLRQQGGMECWVLCGVGKEDPGSWGETCGLCVGEGMRGRSHARKEVYKA